ncbi:glycosyltransferase family 1 protein [Ketobacter sp. MCCC 1A13808]|uniref:glycosyltransferase n=1 Tax=Ketobacter sp. MCCC 1A13808 TaxID=2602738 RepID=UPI0012EB1F45|nr:glycosyltransferase [Ketobacter sp. MCCC 1A13808]MVF13758.1 glycosyltransferase family 1 protein [Ketobacter sp. MCCC 1A13808]
MKSKDVILFSTADWDTPYWTNKQHTAVHLAKMGYRVLYVETVGIRPPKLSSGRDMTRIFKRLWRSFRGPSKARENVWVLSPLTVPFFHGSAFISMLNTWLLKAFLNVSLLILRFNFPLIWTYHPYMLDAIKGIQYSKIAYHCVDDLSAIPGVDIESFRTSERKLLEAVDVVFTTSEKLTQHCKQYSHSVHFMPNVVDYEHFVNARDVQMLPEDIACIPSPRIGYVGVLSNFKVDFKLVYEVAGRRPDWHWVFIGEEREGQKDEMIQQLKALPNVHFLGRKSYEVLPKYMAGLDVATLPTLINDYTSSMFPMKLFEYLASGVRVVSTPLQLGGVEYLDVKVASDTDSFCTCLLQQIKKGKIGIQESRSQVGANTWKARIEKMMNLLSVNVGPMY